MYYSYLSESCRLEALSIIELCLELTSSDQFDSILKKTRRLIGYEMMACGIGVRNGGSMKVVSSLNEGFPEEFISTIILPTGRIASPLSCRWLENQSPQVLDVNDKLCQHSSDMITFYQRFSIHNVMSHGVLNCEQGYASYFGFANIAGGVGDHHVNLMRILVPHLHAAYMQVEKPRLPAVPETITNFLESNTEILSKREFEVIEWLLIGKTNWEIAQILSINEETVKSHVKGIIKKLGANSRQHAVAKALQMKIIAVPVKCMHSLF